MGQDVIPSFVEDEELLDRVIFEPSFFCDGELSTAAFALRNVKNPESYISVLRDKYCDIAKEVESFPERSNGDSAIGYAQLVTKQVRSIKSMDPAQVIVLDVLSHSSEARPSHAGIHATVNDRSLTGEDAAHTSPIALYVQSKLLNISKYYMLERGVRKDNKIIVQE